MRLVKEESEILSGLRGARSEAKAAFGNDAVYIEKYIESPHHIEFQVLSDTHGNAIHLGERDCSLQRRHQKVLEEAPGPVIDEATRERIGKVCSKFTELVARTNHWILAKRLRSATVIVLMVGFAFGISYVLWPKVEYLPSGNRNFVLPH